MISLSGGLWQIVRLSPLMHPKIYQQVTRRDFAVTFNRVTDLLSGVTDTE